MDIIEIWNIVYIEHKDQNNNINKVMIDSGGGFERLLTLINQLDSNFDTDVLCPIYDSLKPHMLTKDIQQKIADFTKSAVFLVSEDLKPASKNREYVLRFLIRSIAYYVKNISLAIQAVIDSMQMVYPNIKNHQKNF